jgi:putative transcriptional regulator
LIYFKLNDILERKEITKYSLSKMTGIDNNTIAKICNNESKQIKLETIEKICIALNITPNDLLEVSQLEVALARRDLSNVKIPYYDYNSDVHLNEISVENYIKQQEQKQKEDDENYQAYLENKDEIDKWSASLQARFDSELSLDKLVSEFIDKIIDTLLLNFEFDKSIRQTLESFKGYDYFKTKIKIDKFYDTFYRFFNFYSEDKFFVELLTNIKNIYSIGGLEKLADEKIIDLTDSIKVYLNNIKQKD